MISPIKLAGTGRTEISASIEVLGPSVRYLDIGVTMTPAIRIIRAPSPPPANLLADEREEQILAVAKKVAEASGYITQDKINSCADKLRSVSELMNRRSPDQLAQDISRSMNSQQGVRTFITHADLDIERIMELLEG
jgi:hypothetical protein